MDWYDNSDIIETWCIFKLLPLWILRNSPPRIVGTPLSASITNNINVLLMLKTTVCRGSKEDFW